MRFSRDPKHRKMLAISDALRKGTATQDDIALLASYAEEDRKVAEAKAKQVGYGQSATAMAEALRTGKIGNSAALQRAMAEAKQAKQAQEQAQARVSQREQQAGWDFTPEEIARFDQQGGQLPGSNALEYPQTPRGAPTAEMQPQRQPQTPVPAPSALQAQSPPQMPIPQRIPPPPQAPAPPQALAPQQYERVGVTEAEARIQRAQQDLEIARRLLAKAKINRSQSPNRTSTIRNRATSGLGNIKAGLKKAQAGILPGIIVRRR